MFLLAARFQKIQEGRLQCATTPHTASCSLLYSLARVLHDIASDVA